MRSYVHNCTYENKDYAYPAGKETGFECWLMWDESTLYGFVEVTDYSPVTYAFKDYKTDCLELNFILTDWARFADKGSNVYSDIGDPGLARFRISNPVGATVSALYELLPQNGGLSVEDELSGLSKCAVVKSDKGYNVEFSIKVPDSIVHLVCTPGAHIGFGIQCNDDVNDNQNRDAIIYSTNLDDTHGKTGEFVMLDKDGSRPDAPVSREPAATTAEVTTKAPRRRPQPRRRPRRHRKRLLRLPSERPLRRERPQPRLRALPIRRLHPAQRAAAAAISAPVRRLPLFRRSSALPLSAEKENNIRIISADIR